MASACHLCCLLLDPVAADSMKDRSIIHSINFSVCHYEPGSGDRAWNMTSRSLTHFVSFQWGTELQILKEAVSRERKAHGDNALLIMWVLGLLGTCHSS